jgi:hypothetical protein
MQLAAGIVVDGKIIIEGGPLPEDAVVTIPLAKWRKPLRHGMEWVSEDSREHTLYIDPTRLQGANEVSIHRVLIQVEADDHAV